MEPTLERLIQEREIQAVVTRLFVATDRRDWQAVEGCLADTITLDMSSLDGGPATALQPSQVTKLWSDGFKTLDSIHHQIGNFQVDLWGNEASVACYGLAFHHRKVAHSEATRRFVGTYDIHLVRGAAGWRIDVLRFNAKFVDGNLEPSTSSD